MLVDAISLAWKQGTPHSKCKLHHQIQIKFGRFTELAILPCDVMKGQQLSWLVSMLPPQMTKVNDCKPYLQSQLREKAKVCSNAKKKADKPGRRPRRLMKKDVERRLMLTN